MTHSSQDPDWGVFDGKDFVDVAPVGHHHQLDTGKCWCKFRVERYHRPLVVHSLHSHCWARTQNGDVCLRCEIPQTPKNSDDLCKGPPR